MSPKKLKPPIRHPRNPIYHYNEVTDYLEALHKKNFRDYASHFLDSKQPYQDFWHYLTDSTEIHNGCEFCLPDVSVLQDKTVPAWVREILKHYYDFLGRDFDEPMWVEW